MKLQQRLESGANPAPHPLLGLSHFSFKPLENFGLFAFRSLVRIFPAIFGSPLVFLVLKVNFLSQGTVTRRASGASSRWANVLEQASASRSARSKRSLSLASVGLCALLLPTTLSSSSQAQTTATGTPRGLSPYAIVPQVSAPVAVSNIVPLPGAVAAPSSPHSSSSSPQLQSKPVAAPVLVPVPTMRLRVVVSGRLKEGEVPVKPLLTVGQALVAMGVSLSVLDRVTPDVSVLARNNLVVRVSKVENRLRKRRLPIAAPLLYRPSTKIKAGRAQEVQAPRVGAYEVTERVWTLDGRETRREFVSKRLAVPPVPRVIALGARSHLMPSSIRPHKRYARAYGYATSFRGGSPRDRMSAEQNLVRSADGGSFRPVRCIENVLATGYSAGRAGGALSNWTATGVRCTYGAVAVDPRLIPLGTKMYIEGYGYGFACDTGGAIKGKHIDLAFDSPRAAFAHGKRRTRVWILGR